MLIIFVTASHQTGLDTRSKARRPIKVGIKGRRRSGTSRDSNPAGLCCWSAHLVQCDPDEASSFTNPNVGPGTYASLRLKLDTWSSAVHGWQRGQKCSSSTRRLPSRSWGPIRPRVCSWFRSPIRHECQTAQPKGRGAIFLMLIVKWQRIKVANLMQKLPPDVTSKIADVLTELPEQNPYDHLQIICRVDVLIGPATSYSRQTRKCYLCSLYNSGGIFVRKDRKAALWTGLHYRNRICPQNVSKSKFFWSRGSTA